MEPYAVVIVDSGVKLSTPATRNVDECFPDYSNMYGTKEQYQEGGGYVWELTFCFKNSQL